MAETNKVYELTPTQQAMLVYSLYAPRSKAYFEQVCYAYEGPLDSRAFAEAWRRVVDRHDILRATFSWDHSQLPVQTVCPQVTLPFDEQDWRELSAPLQQERLKLFLHQDSDRIFDLAQAPLLRVAILQTQNDAFWIVVSNHHIILDGWSMSLLRQEVSRIYQELIANKPAELESAHQFGEYVEWLGNQSSSEAEAFWRQEMNGFELPNDLPIDQASGKPSNPNESFGEQQLTLSPALTQAIRSSARRHHLTVSTLLQGAWALLLGRYCRANEVAFGITVSGRPYDLPGVESMVGLLINTLPVRVEVDPHESCLLLLKKLQLRVSGLFEHEQTSLKDIQQWIGLPANSPLIDTLVVFENFAGSGSLFDLDGFVSVLSSKLSRTNFPLTLVVDPGSEMRLQLVYHRSRFADDAVNRVLGHLVTILESMAEDLVRPTASIPLLTKAETQTLLQDWNSHQGLGVEEDPVTRMFELQAKLTPDAIALVHEERQLTYSELNSRANQLAHHLETLGVGPETMVGICTERSVEMIIAVLGILKAGAAYVPLDPAYPQQRLAYMLADTGIQVVLTSVGAISTIPEFHGTVVCLDAETEDDAKQISACSAENMTLAPESGQLAYLIYTSGSTGTPKGTMIEHHSLSNFTVGAAAGYGITPGDRILQFASLSFDASIEEIFPALSVGAAVVLRTDPMLSSAADFLQKCNEFGITILDLPTAYWHELAAELAADKLALPESLRLVIIGGEKALPERLASWHAHVGQSVRLVNTYGPTESTIVATTFDLAADAFDGPEIPIGRPVRGLTAYVLDEMGRPVPVGIPGELHLGGAGVARGYLRRPGVTAEKFVADPFSNIPAARLYRTGDLVRYRSDGNLEFLGRIDNQVKIRGFRIELEEIEQALRAHEHVFDAVVMAQDETDGEKRLVAYVVPARDAQLSVSELRFGLAEALPAYMIPATFMFIDALPVAPTGKIDRKALPRLDQTTRTIDENFAAPRSHLEESIAEVWNELLKVDRVGIHDNFFELGGHSLLGAKLISNLRRRLNVELSLVDIFQSPTVSRMAALIYQRQTEGEAEDELASLLAEIENLSDEEAQQKFAEELARGGARAQALKLALISTGTAALEILSNTL